MSREDEGSGGEGDPTTKRVGYEHVHGGEVRQVGRHPCVRRRGDLLHHGTIGAGRNDDGGEEGWKEKVADKIMERAKQKEEEAAAAAAAGGGQALLKETMTGAQPPAA